MTTHVTLTGVPDFKIYRREDEVGAVMLRLEDVNGVVVEFDCGDNISDADALVEALDDAHDEATEVQENWEDRPDEEDGYVSEGSTRECYVSLSGKSPDGMPRDGYPSRDIATYELARMMADAGYFPNAWYVNERGNTDEIGAEVRAFHDEGGDKLKPLEGVEFSEDDTVIFTSDPYQDPMQWNVVADYGTLGLILSSYGEPEFFDGEQRAEVSLYEDEDEED
jgi:hypothetical protein